MADPGQGRRAVKDQLRARKPGDECFVKVSIGDARQILNTFYDAIAQRAYEIYRRRGGLEGGELQDWADAERELLHPLCCGTLELEDRVIVSTDASALDAKQIEICVEPRRLIVVGMKEAADTSGARQAVYRVCALPVAVDPSRVQVKQRGCTLDIVMRKAGTGKGRNVAAKAA
jgi:hypothetical protein